MTPFDDDDYCAWCRRHIPLGHGTSRGGYPFCGDEHADAYDAEWDDLEDDDQ